jgi:hypothetical protein
MLISAILMATAIAAFGIRIWIKGSFADSEIGRNENMKKLGIHCVKDEEYRLHSGKEIENSTACSSCGLKTSCHIK